MTIWCVHIIFLWSLLWYFKTAFWTWERHKEQFIDSLGEGTFWEKTLKNIYIHEINFFIHAPQEHGCPFTFKCSVSYDSTCKPLALRSLHWIDNTSRHSCVYQSSTSSHKQRGALTITNRACLTGEWAGLSSRRNQAGWTSGWAPGSTMLHNWGQF